MKKITCEQAQLWFTYLIDDVPLEEEQKIQLENHLKSCENCQSLYKELKIIDETIQVNMDAAINRHISSQRLGAFLDGEIDSEIEKKIIQAHLQECDSCREMYQKMAEINDLEEVFKLNSKTFILKKNLKESEKKLGERIRQIFARPKIAIPIAAAIALLVIFIPVFLQMMKPDSLPDLAVVKPFPFIETQMRGADVRFDKLQRKGMKFYQDGDYEKAILLLKQIVAADSTRFVDRFYLGVCYLMENQLDNAEKEFLEVSNYSLLAEKANWYLAQIYLLKNEKEKALKALDVVISLHQALYYAKAKELREKVLQMVEKP